MRIALWLVAWPLMTGSAFGWGCEGHQMIALIARAHLTPAASAAVDRLLRENPIDPALNRYCKDRPDDLMADAATWADDARNIENTGEWHYIDIPLAIKTGSIPQKDAMKWCVALPDGRPGCILTAIETEWAILRDAKQSDAARARALRYLIHFAGDIAQPLHDVDNHDQGGNCTTMTSFGESRNLHSIWDSQLIARELEMTKSNQSAYARKLDESFDGRWSEWGESKSDVLAWAWEGHERAAVAYGDLKPRIPVAREMGPVASRDECDAERVAVGAMHITIGDEYAAQVVPVIREQLAKAGYRLAGLLNATFQ